LQGAQRGATLTQRMLAFARKQELSLQPTALPILVAGMIGFLERTLGPTVEIRTDFPARLPRVQTDPSQLENALLNLAVNARDAMPDGGVITISAEPRSAMLEDGLPAGDYVRFVVADTGEGMDEDTLNRAREPFFTTKGVGKGTGLGLSMVHGLSLQSGGKLEITSHVGEGTAVELWLPVTQAMAAPRVAPPEPTHTPGRSLVVLAVDDDALVLMNTAALLEDLGHEVLSVASGQTALKILDDRPAIDLVITDQAMPQMTGTQLRDAIRERGFSVPVIIASGYAEIPSDAGSDAPRLSKPFTQDELARALDAALERAEA
jgi:CheY-like chemotaxis protein